MHTPQYSQHSIDRYEKIFGRDFVSSGGLDTTRRFVAELGLRPGTRVLDVGCGLGGSAFHMAREYGAQVHGIDLLPQMIEEAQRRAEAYGIAGVRFEQGDILQADLARDSYDLVYSRDAFLHIAGKQALFRVLLQALRPGGTLFLTDYARGPQPGSDAFEQYRTSNGYDLRELEAYAGLVREAGFASVALTDHTREFTKVLEAEMQRAREESLAGEDREYLLDRWQKKVNFCNDGDMRWCSVRAIRP